MTDKDRADKRSALLAEYLQTKEEHVLLTSEAHRLGDRLIALGKQLQANPEQIVATPDEAIQKYDASVFYLSFEIPTNLGIARLLADLTNAAVKRRLLHAQITTIGITLAD